MSTSHLGALELGLSNERARLRASKTAFETKLRQVWVIQCEKEIAKELEFLGIQAVDEPMTDSQLLEELGL